ncbi:hypothetical protein DSI28_14570 [Mycobacterium tuberculosis]|nr:hypothetical protein DSI28_14570 [Mycobacterium tuberculosis]
MKRAAAPEQTMEERTQHQGSVLIRANRNPLPLGDDPRCPKGLGPLRWSKRTATKACSDRSERPVLRPSQSA